MKTTSVSKELKEELYDLLMNEEGTIPIEQALSNAKKRWEKQ